MVNLSGNREPKPLRRSKNSLRHAATLGSLSVAFALLAKHQAAAHCDTLDGPVVADAVSALEKGDVTPVLKWVGKDSEGTIRTAFAEALKRRSADDSSHKREDTRFFETLVRVHRAGEGEPFTGLKQGGTADPGLIAADKALAEGSITGLSDEITESVREGLCKRFADALEKKKHADDSVEDGRAYVAAYVAYAHYVEAIHAIASGGSKEHRHMHAADEQQHDLHTEPPKRKVMP